MCLTFIEYLNDEWGKLVASPEAFDLWVNQLTTYEYLQWHSKYELLKEGSNGKILGLSE
jgi:hypothetical protein